VSLDFTLAMLNVNLSQASTALSPEYIGLPAVCALSALINLHGRQQPTTILTASFARALDND